MTDKKSIIILFVLFLGSATIAFSVSYIKGQKTIIGYELGKLKKREKYLLEMRSQLKMELAKLSSKKNLIKLTTKKN